MGVVGAPPLCVEERGSLSKTQTFLPPRELPRAEIDGCCSDGIRAFTQRSAGARLAVQRYTVTSARAVEVRFKKLGFLGL